MHISKLLSPILLVSGIALLLAGCDVSGSSADGLKEVSVKMKLQNTSQPKT